EIMGDRAVSVAKHALAEWERDPTVLGLLDQMAEQAGDLIRDARTAWREQDLGLAARLEQRDDALDNTYVQLTVELLAQHNADANALVMHAMLVGRHLERIADHAVAIGDRVRYMVTG